MVFQLYIKHSKAATSSIHWKKTGISTNFNTFCGEHLHGAEDQADRNHSSAANGCSAPLVAKLMAHRHIFGKRGSSCFTKNLQNK